MPALPRAIVVHRWLGLTGGLMVLVWYLTGLGLHWRPMPSVLNPEEFRRTQGESFALTLASQSFTDVLQGRSEVREVRLRRAGSRLVYEVRKSDGTVEIVDAQSGESLLPVNEALARDIAQTLMPGSTIETAVLMSEPDAYYTNRRQPAYKVTFDDFGKTRVYVGSETASVPARAGIQHRLYQHFVNHPHYFSFDIPIRRRHPVIFEGVLMILNILALVLVASGVVLSFRRFSRAGLFGGDGFRQQLVRKWHYVVGTVFSITTLGFVVSAFFLLFRDNTVPQLGIVPTQDEQARIVRPLDPAQILPLPLTSLDLSRTSVAMDRLSMVSLKRLLDVPFYVLRDTAGRQETVRADTGQPFTLDQSWFANVASAFMGAQVKLSDVEYLSEYDTYYYARHNRYPPLPAYRATVDDDDGTLLYLSAETGEVTGRASREFRIRRWLVTGPHTWDWPFLVRRPPLWTAVSMTVLGGGLWVTVSGLYLGMQALLGTVRNRRYSVSVQRRAS
jgi:hypothetical protein